MFSITGERDHTPFGGQGVQLVWGQRPDGSLAHISEAGRGAKCDCVCPACELALIAKRGPRLADHFAHRGGTACAGVRETNAHAWAKKILEARKEIYLPPVVGSAGGKRLQTHPGQLYQFESAQLEKRDGSIIPDVVLIDAEGRELIVEILVTHACDEEKIAKIRKQGMPGLEIDLSRLRSATSEEIVAEALIGASATNRAPRKWLHNSKIERAGQRLEAELARQAAAREAAREQQANAIVHAAAAIKIVSTDATLADMATVYEYGRAELIRIDVEAARGFRVPALLWQAAVLARVIFPAADEWGAFIDARAARQAILDCIAPAFRTEPGGELRSAVWRTEPGFLFPSVSIARYLKALAARGVLQHDSYDVFRLDEDEALSIRRRAVQLAAQRSRNESALRRLRTIWDRIPVEDRESRSLDDWLEQPIEGFGVRLTELVQRGDRSWDAFNAGLCAIERMFRDGTPAPGALGLPIAAEIGRAAERARIAQAEAEKARRAAEAQAARERDMWLTARADRALGPERSRDWLGTVPIGGTVSFRDLARTSSDGLDQAMAGLTAAERELAREREAERCRADLRSSAIGVFGSERAEVFLLSTHPRIGMSPWARCTDSVGLQICRTLLPRKGTAPLTRSRCR